jgi:hypothetical protein
MDGILNQAAATPGLLQGELERVAHALALPRGRGFGRVVRAATLRQGQAGAL